MRLGDPNRLPEPTVRACGECPWRRESAPGWLGPFTAEQWLGIARSEAPVACHRTICGDDNDWDNGTIRQCAGMAQYRRNTGKRPRDPEVAVAEDVDNVLFFGGPVEFREHHGRFECTCPITQPVATCAVHGLAQVI